MHETHVSTNTTSPELIEFPTTLLNENHKIAEILAEPADLNAVIECVEQGKSEVRDVAHFTPQKRNAVMQYGRQVFLRKEKILPSVEQIYGMDEANKQFRNEMSTRRKRDASSMKNNTLTGFRFSKELQGFLGGKGTNPWALHIDNHIKQLVRGEPDITESNFGVNKLLDTSENLTSNNEFAHHIWETVSRRYPSDMAWYLAERSLYSENWQRDRFQSEMVFGKKAASRLVGEFSTEFELPEEHKRRAQRQLELADFGAFDQILLSKGALDGVVLGDYVPGTLRIEVKLGKNGTRHQSRNIPDASGTVCHELFHASSAHSKPSNTLWRLGLAFQDKGFDANEGMTELLTRLSLGRVMTRSNEEGRKSYNFSSNPRQKDNPNLSNACYEEQTSAMLMLFLQRPDAFKTLFRAYYGFVPDKEPLAEAFDLFDDLLKNPVSDSIGS